MNVEVGLALCLDGEMLETGCGMNDGDVPPRLLGGVTYPLGGINRPRPNLGGVVVGGVLKDAARGIDDGDGTFLLVSVV